MFNSWTSYFTLAEQLLRKSHALIVTSPVGHGAGPFAHILAQSRLCEAQQGVKPCHQCPACHWFSQGNHPDFRFVGPHSADAEGEGDDAGAEVAEAGASEAKKSKRKSQEIVVGAVRALADFVQVGAHRQRGRVVVVQPAHAMNAITGNTLLKTLEEPTPSLLFLLVTEAPGALLPTIRSRCQVLALPSVPLDEGAAWLASSAGLALAKAKLALQAEGGAPFTAQALADPENAAIHRLVIEALAGLPDTGLVDSAGVLQEAEPNVVFPILQRWLEDLARVAVGSSPRFFADRQERLEALVAKAKLRQRLASLLAVANVIERDSRLVNHPLNWRLFCEQTLLRYCELYKL
jgi:DNA polymerase III subunit delta'